MKIHPAVIGPLITLVLVVGFGALTIPNSPKTPRICDVFTLTKGMSPEEVVALCGQPNSRNRRTDMSSGVVAIHEQWIYGRVLALHHQDVYFDNGQVSAWQDWEY